MFETPSINSQVVRKSLTVQNTLINSMIACLELEQVGAKLITSTFLGKEGYE